MKNYQYVLDIKTPFIKKLYDKEDDYKVELLTPYGILEELKKLQEENADLEAKLAEKDEKIKYYKDWLDDVLLTGVDHESYYATINEYEEEISQLKQQIAEKEKEYQSFKKIADENVNYLKNRILEETRSYNQDKIELAVEQLTQAKEYIKNSLENMWNGNAEMTCRDRNIIDGIYNKIDNQITDLKGNEDE